MIEELNQTLDKCFSAKFKVKEGKQKFKGSSEKVKMDKKTFKKILSELKIAADNSLSLVEGFGIDLTPYEEPFVRAIDHLFYLHFTDDQIAILNAYLHGMLDIEIDNEDESATIEITTKKGETKTYKFETPDDVWAVIQEVGSV